VNLDDDLRRLFTDDGDRLDVPVRADAEQVIVAGARRVRRRRHAMAGAGALAVVAVAAGAIALASGRPDAMPPAVTITTTPTSTSAGAASPSSVAGTSVPVQPPPGTGTRKNSRTNEPPVDTGTQGPVDPPPLSFEVLGPLGIGGLRLGQPLADAQSSGMLGAMIHDGAGSGCDQYQLLISGPDPNFVYVSPSGGDQTVKGIVSVNVQTPEGVGPGWTIAQVKAVYPDLDEQQAKDSGSSLVSTPGTGQANYRFTFTSNGTVTRVTLQTVDQPC
jgi:hypothetical protein